MNIDDNIDSKLLPVYKYYKQRVVELKHLAILGDPWVFLCSSAFIDYLARLVSNNAINGEDYEKFIKDYLIEIDSRYVNFQFQSGMQDLPKQMYLILRCGIIHNFSLNPDETGIKKGGRNTSILVGHNSNGCTHLSKYLDNSNDSIIFTAESFVEDLDKLLDLIFLEKAKSDSTIATNIFQWVTRYPPIG